MTPERWQQIKSALDEAMVLADERREAYLESLGARDPELQREVISLLAAEEAASSRFLRTSAPEALGALAEPSRFVGRRLGPYQLVAEIGRGGMGEVYRAVRVDQEYQQEVAIKVVRAGRDPDFVGSRLRTERQILASFKHPNIARLLDGGTTPERIPYLVMELIEGRPITEYCDEHRLDTTARLRLFMSVCSAVQYAHQRMVIHRDLKPGNILVTSDGVPKLLDFGIAKILEPGVIPTEPDLTVNAFRILTPQYASPEQFKGEPVTAVSDVYSLGVVLYEILTGFQPYPMPPAAQRADDLARVVLDHEPCRPSVVVRPPTSQRHGSITDSSKFASIAAVREGSAERLSQRLRGDLDNILLMAVRKEPEARYASVEQFTADIERYLTGQPVLARGRQFGYLAGKFLRRHKIELSAAAIIVLSLVGGIVTATHQARVAERQRARAERNFARVRTLADSLLFELHDSIQDLPGALEARRLLVKEALQYLAELSGDAASDMGLQRDLAAGYERVGDIQGNPFFASLGDSTGALRSYEMALKLRRNIYAASASPVDALSVARILRLHAAVLAFTGKLQPANDELRKALGLSERIAHMHPNDTRTLEELYREYADLAGVLGGNFDSGNLGDQSAAAVARQHQLAAAKRLVALDPKSDRFRNLEVVAEINIGDELFLRGHIREAAPHYLGAQSPLESLAASAGTAKSLEQLHALYTRLSAVRVWEHHPAAAVSINRAAFEIAQRLLRDTKNSYARLLLATDYINLGDALSQVGQGDEARRNIAQAIDTLSSLQAADATNSEYRVNHGVALYTAGEIEQRDGDHSAALRYFRRALANLMETYSKDPNNADARLHVAGIHVKIADMQATTGDVAGAREGYLQAVSLGGTPGPSASTVEAHYILAAAYNGLGRLALRAPLERHSIAEQARIATACDWFARADQERIEIPEPGANSPGGFFLETSPPGELRSRCAQQTHPPEHHVAEP